MSDKTVQADSSRASGARTRDASTQTDPVPLDPSEAGVGAKDRLSEVGVKTRAYVESRRESFGQERGALLSRIVTLENRVTKAEDKAVALTEQRDELVRRLDQLCSDIEDYHMLVEAHLEAQGGGEGHESNRAS